MRTYTFRSYTSYHTTSSVFFRSSISIGSQIYLLSHRELESHYTNSASAIAPYGTVPRGMAAGLIAYLIAHIQVRCLFGSLDPHRKSRLGIIRSSVQRRNNEWLRPRSGKRIGTESHNICKEHSVSTAPQLALNRIRKLTVWSVSRLMAHQRIITLLRLNNRWCLQIILIEPVHHLIQIRDVLVETSQVNITAFFAVAVRVE